MALEHIDEILTKADGVTSAEVFKVEIEGEENKTSLSVHYRFDSREHLQSYFDHLAPALRQNGIARWGDRVAYTRRILHNKDAVKQKPKATTFGYIH